jgi:hypothetical protein
MPFVMANRGLFTLLNTAVTASTDFRALVLTSAGTLTDAQVEDFNFVSDVLGASGIVEASGTGYARQDLAGVAIAEDDTNNRVAITATAPTMNSVAAGQTWARIVYYVEGGGTDATRVLVGIDTPAATLAPNGGNVTLPALTVYVTDTSA